jgi:hypothetical protein
VTADQAAAAAALAHAAEIKAPAEAKLLDAQADAFAAGAAATVRERMTDLALEASLRRSMNDLRVFGAGFLLGTLAVGLPALAAAALLRLLLGADWRRWLFGSGAQSQLLDLPALPSSATRSENGSGGWPDAEEAAADTYPAAPGAAAKHRRYEPQE